MFRLDSTHSAEGSGRRMSTPLGGAQPPAHPQQRRPSTQAEGRAASIQEDPKAQTHRAVAPLTPLEPTSTGPSGSLGATFARPHTPFADPGSRPSNPLYAVSNELMQVSGYQPKLTGEEPGSQDSEDSMVTSLTPPDPSAPPAPDLLGGGQSMLVTKTPHTAIPMSNGLDEKAKISKRKKSKQKIRQKLFKVKIIVSDLALIFAVLGIALTVAETELTHRGAIDKNHVASIVLLAMVVASTIILVALIVATYYIDFKLIVLNSGTADWRFAITPATVAQFLLEVAVCAICPIPQNIDIPWFDAGSDFSHNKVGLAPLNIVLTIPMFLRFYLLCRFFTHHSRHYQDTATRSIAALNHIPVNFAFVMKTFLYEHPLKLLISFTVSFCMIMAWLWMHCEKSNIHASSDFATALWFVVITFLSIGYGDVIATTYCGRSMAVITGVVGAIVLSAVVAVVSRYLELSRPEKHVNQFLADNRLGKERNNLAASIIQHAWFIRKYRQRLTTDSHAKSKLAQHNRKMIFCISRFRRVIWETRKSSEKNDSLIDVIMLTNELQRTLTTMQKVQDRILVQMETMHADVQEIRKKRRHGRLIP